MIRGAISRCSLLSVQELTTTILRWIMRCYISWCMDSPQVLQVPSLHPRSAIMLQPSTIREMTMLTSPLRQQKDPCWVPFLDPPSPLDARPTLSSHVPNATPQTDGSSQTSDDPCPGSSQTSADPCPRSSASAVAPLQNLSWVHTRRCICLQLRIFVI